MTSCPSLFLASPSSPVIRALRPAPTVNSRLPASDPQSDRNRARKWGDYEEDSKDHRSDPA